MVSEVAFAEVVEATVARQVAVADGAAAAQAVRVVAAVLAKERSSRTCCHGVSRTLI